MSGCVVALHLNTSMLQITLTYIIMICQGCPEVDLNILIGSYSVIIFPYWPFLRKQSWATYFCLQKPANSKCTVWSKYLIINCLLTWLAWGILGILVLDCFCTDLTALSLYYHNLMAIYSLVWPSCLVVKNIM